MKIIVNGSPREVADGTSVADLLRELGLTGKPVAVERNRTLVPKKEQAAALLQEGDRLEVVSFVGGG